MLAGANKVITAITFLIGILRSMADLLTYFEQFDENEDNLEEVEDTVIDLLLVIYDVIKKYTDIELPISKEGVKEFVNATIKTVEKALKILNLFN